MSENTFEQVTDLVAQRQEEVYAAIRAVAELFFNMGQMGADKSAELDDIGNAALSTEVTNAPAVDYSAEVVELGEQRDRSDKVMAALESVEAARDANQQTSAQVYQLDEVRQARAERQITAAEESALEKVAAVHREAEANNQPILNESINEERLAA